MVLKSEDPEEYLLEVEIGGSRMYSIALTCGRRAESQRLEQVTVGGLSWASDAALLEKRIYRVFQ
jgi:hypothetical protein